MAKITKVEADKRLKSLRQEYMKFQQAHMEIAKYIDPTRGIFNGNRSTIGKMIDHKVLLDSRATRAKRIASSGLQTGMTDPSRPWFKLTMDDMLIQNIPGLKEWIEDVTMRMYDVMGKSNIYKVFQNCYDELVEFGTGCFLILEDFDDVIRGRSFTAGEYYLGTDNKGRVNTFAREFEMTVCQMVEEFGLESVSAKVKSHYQNKELDVLIKVNHLIEKNKNKVEGYEDYLNMPYNSYYWENGEGDSFLATRGYRTFRVVAPRWDAITTDMVYGYSPSWHALGDVKQLQTLTKDKLIAEQKAYDPPTIEDSSVVGHSNKMPGGVTKISSNVNNAGVRAAYQIDAKLAEFTQSIQELHQKIDEHFFNDVFMMISNIEGTSTTAFEIAKRDQERLMQLGPILHNVNEEMQDEVIDIVFEIMNENGLIPPPPQGVEGMELKVQYISILAQAQKAVGLTNLERTIGYVMSIAPVFPEAKDNFDIDEAVRQMNEMGGNSAKIILDREQVASIREQKAKQQQQMMALQAGQMAADSAHKLGKTPMGQGSVLDGLANANAKIQK